MAKSNQTDHIGHFAMYRNIESLCCTPGTNVVLQVNYMSVKKNNHDQMDVEAGEFAKFLLAASCY